MSYPDIRTLDVVPGRLRAMIEFVIRWLPLVIVTGLWELISGLVVAREVLPPPSEVLLITAEITISGQIIPHLLISLYRITLGLGLSIVIGVLLGIGMARSRPVENFFDIFLALTYPIPKTALVPLAILWLGVGTETAVLIVFLACLLPIILNSYNAAKNVDQNLVWSAQMMGTSKRRILWKVVIPDTIPEIITGIRQAIPFAFIALVSAELIASDRGIGHEILRHGQIGNYPSMFAVIVIISAVAYISVRGFELLKTRMLVWT